MSDNTVNFELLLLNNDAGNSRVILKRNKTTGSFTTPLFELELRTILFDAFRRMVNLNIRRITGTGSIKKQGDNPQSLQEVIVLDDEYIRIETHDGYRTLSSYQEGHAAEIDRALMLLVWKWSPHFASDNMDGTNDFSSSMRACVVCGKVQHGVMPGQLTGGIHYKSEILHVNSVRQRYVYPSDHCFNPRCYSHEIERMIDPAYVFIPPKPGEDLETDLARTLGEKVVKKDHPMGTDVIKKGSQKDPAVKGFEKDMCE